MLGIFLGLNIYSIHTLMILWIFMMANNFKKILVAHIFSKKVDHLLNLYPPFI